MSGLLAGLIKQTKKHLLLQGLCKPSMSSLWQWSGHAHFNQPNALWRKHPAAPSWSASDQVTLTPLTCSCLTANVRPDPFALRKDLRASQCICHALLTARSYHPAAALHLSFRLLHCEALDNCQSWNNFGSADPRCLLAPAEAPPHADGNRLSRRPPGHRETCLDWRRVGQQAALHNHHHAPAQGTKRSQPQNGKPSLILQLICLVQMPNSAVR